MQFYKLFSAVLLLSVANAFAPLNRASPKAASALLRAQMGDVDDDSAVLSRRDAMRQGATATMATLSMASFLVANPETALADIYDEQEKERKLKQKENSVNARKLVPGILFGGTALSVPFFLPNLLRLGKKFMSFGDDDGYN
jgi:hypothetical protein